MSNLHRTATLCVALLCTSHVHAQELATAGYVGVFEGAGQACAAAFPEKATVYRDTLYRAVKCHMGPSKFLQWHKGLRNSKLHGPQYRQGYHAGLAILPADAAARIEQCRRLETIVCSAGTVPLVP